MKKNIILLVMMLWMGIGMVACGNATGGDSVSGESTTGQGNTYLKVWVPSEEVEMTKQMCDLFLEKYGYDTMTIDCIDMSSDDSIQNLIVDNTKAADLLLFSTCDGTDLVEAGFFLPITLNYDEIVTKFNSTAIESATFGDFLYGVPIEADTWVLYYNKEIFSEDEARSVEKMLNKDTGVQYNFSAPISSNWFVESFFYANGCPLFGDDGKQYGQCTWNNEAGYQVGQYLINLANNPKYYEDMSGFAYDYFVNGELGAFCASNGSAAGLKEVMGEHLGIIKLPVITIDGKEMPLRCFVDYTAIGVNSYTKYPKEAQELAIWLGSEECQLMRYEQFGVLPTLSALYEEESVKEHVASDVLLSQLDQCVIVPKMQQMNDYWSSATALGEEIVNGTITEENLQHCLDVLVDNITVEFISD